MNITEIKKPYMFYTDLVKTQNYDKSVESLSKKYKFNSQGQLKLLIGELYFFNVLIKKNVLCQETTVIYIGSAPGNHIKYLYNYLDSLGWELKWILIDGRDHHPAVAELKRVTIIQRFVDEQYLIKLRSTVKKNKIVLISDIRSLRGKEPTTEDLLNDYSLQNLMVDILKPTAFSLKWRCPFPNQWIRDFYIPYGEEFLQPFSPAYSAELRLINACLKKPLRLIRIDKAVASEYEKKMFYLNNNIRKSIVLDFDYPHQEYDFFHLYYILKHIIIPPSLSFSTEKQKVLFLQESIFKELRISL